MHSDTIKLYHAGADSIRRKSIKFNTVFKLIQLSNSTNVMLGHKRTKYKIIVTINYI